MNDKIRDIVFDSDISDAEKYYWGYQYDLGKTSIVPYLAELNVFKKGCNIAEIGSAEGGVLHACIDYGAGSGLGTDIAMERLQLGRRISAMTNLNVEYVYHDIINEEPHENWKNSFDLVILRDVIEHLDDAGVALRNIKKIIKPGGFLLVTFPPYYSPYGGHQHTVAGKLPSRLPYIHLLPKKMFLNLISSGRARDIDEVKRLMGIKLMPEHFMNEAKVSGYNIFHQEYYLIRPVFKMKFGLPTIKLTPISWIPIIRDYLSLEALYILKKEEN